MCIICLQFQKDKDAWDAYWMTINALREKRSTDKVDIEEEHLVKISKEFLNKAGYNNDYNS